MLDKIVKALFRQHKHPMKNRERTRRLGSWGMKDCGRSFKRFLLPSFPRPESRVVIVGWISMVLLFAVIQVGESLPRPLIYISSKNSSLRSRFFIC